MLYEVITNKRANLYNQGIRASILYRDSEISGGDRLLIVRNNYFWSRDYNEVSLIANRITSYNVCYTKLLRAFHLQLRRREIGQPEAQPARAVVLEQYAHPLAHAEREVV